MEEYNKKNFEIDEEKLKKIEIIEKNENENYMKKYNKIVKEITEYEGINNNNEGISNNLDFQKILPINLFRSKKKN